MQTRTRGNMIAILVLATAIVMPATAVLAAAEGDGQITEEVTAVPFEITAASDEYVAVETMAMKFNDAGDLV